MHGLYLFYIIYLFLLRVPSSAFVNHITITGDTVLGGKVYITCSWSSTHLEKRRVTKIGSPKVGSGNNMFYFKVTELGKSIPGSNQHRGLSIHVNLSGNTTTMTISDLHCSDEHEYYCSHTYDHLHHIKTSINTTFLSVKVRPKAPTLEIKLKDSTDTIDMSLRVTTVTAKCNANIGRPSPFIIEWKLYYNCDPENIAADDPRITSTTTVPLHPEDVYCTQRIAQTFKMQVPKRDQTFILACFVNNLAFPKHTADFCINTTTDLCSESAPIIILNPGDTVHSFTNILADIRATKMSALVNIIIAVGIICVSLGVIFGAASGRTLRTSYACEPLDDTLPDVDKAEKDQAAFCKELEESLEILRVSLDKKYKLDVSKRKAPSITQLPGF